MDALTEPISLPLARIDDGEIGEPAALRRRDGASVYTRHGTALYTSAKILSAERRILHAATLDGSRTVTDADVEIALADSAARGKDLNPGQVVLVTEMATKGRRVALALAPAGAGKTTAMAALSHAWRNSGDTVLIFNTTRRKRLNLHDFEQSSSNHGAVVDGLNRAVLPWHKWNPIQQDIAQRLRRAAVQCYRPCWQRELESP